MIINNVEDLTLMLSLTNNELYKATYFWNVLNYSAIKNFKIL
jgi:hypothetical protein